MPIPTFSDITSSILDGKSGAFRARKDVGKAGLKFNTKSANGYKFEADGSFPGKTAFSFTYPKLGYKKFTGDLKVKGTVAGGKDTYKIQYKKISLDKVGSLDLTYDMAKKTLDAELTSKQDKFTLGAKASFAQTSVTKKNKEGVETETQQTDVSGNANVVVGDGDTNFGVEFDFDLSKDGAMFGPLGFPKFAAAYRPASGTELFFRTQGNVPFNKKGPALEIDLGATTVVDANNTVSFLYGLDCSSDSCNQRGAAVAGTRNVGGDTLEYCVGADGAFSGSYQTGLSDRLTGKLHFSNSLGNLSLNNTKFGYSVEFA